MSGTSCSLIHTLWQATAHGLLPTPPVEGQLQNKGLAEGDERREGNQGCSLKINGRRGGVSDMLDYATIGSNYSICMMRWGSLKEHIVAHV